MFAVHLQYSASTAARIADCPRRFFLHKVAGHGGWSAAASPGVKLLRGLGEVGAADAMLGSVVHFVFGDFLAGLRQGSQEPNASESPGRVLSHEEFRDKCFSLFAAAIERSRNTARSFGAWLEQPTRVFPKMKDVLREHLYGGEIPAQRLSELKGKLETGAKNFFAPVKEWDGASFAELLVEVEILNRREKQRLGPESAHPEVLRLERAILDESKALKALDAKRLELAHSEEGCEAGPEWFLQELSDLGSEARTCLENTAALQQELRSKYFRKGWVFAEGWSQKEGSKGEFPFFWHPFTGHGLPEGWPVKIYSKMDLAFVGEDGCLRVVDLKTGKQFFGHKEVFQLLLYGEYCSRLQYGLPKDEQRLEDWFLGGKEPQVSAFPGANGDGLAAGLNWRLAEYLARFTNPYTGATSIENWPAIPSEGKCHTCPYAAVCQSANQQARCDVGRTNLGSRLMELPLLEE